MRELFLVNNKMSLRKPRRDSDVILSKYNQKELLFKFLIIGDYGVGKYIEFYNLDLFFIFYESAALGFARVILIC